MLRENRDRIGAATAGADAAFLRQAPAKGEWPATVILAHLRACADVWGSCTIAILERTLNWYALGLAAHERSHVKQILRIATIATSAGKRLR